MGTNELSYDKFHKNSDQLFRVMHHDSLDLENIWTANPFPLTPALKYRYPEIIDQTRYWNYTSLVKYGNNKYTERDFRLVDSSFFNMFRYPFIRGNPNASLSDISSIVITEETAEKYFGNEDPIGKVLNIRQTTNLIVTGVIKNLPGNSHIQFDMVARIELMPEERLNRWPHFDCPAYVKLSEKSTVEEVNQKIKFFYQQIDPEWTDAQPYLQNIKKVHLSPFGRNLLLKLVYTFSIIGILILLIACINFVNLTTGRYLNRAREVGIRKVNGAQKKQLITQFFGETMLLSLISINVAVILLELVLPVFNNVINKQLSVNYTQNPVFMAGLVCIFLFTGIVSAIYPSFFLSSFKPAKVLKANIDPKSGLALLRKILVISQFTFSIFLIISTTVVFKQMHFIKNKDMGFDREHILIIGYNTDLQRSFDVFKEKLLQNPDIINVTASSTLPTDINWTISFDWEGNPDSRFLGSPYLMADYDYFKTLGVEVVMGRAFSKDFPADDSISYIINERAMELMDIEDPIGKRIYFNHIGFPEHMRDGRIIGVVKNFHFRSIHSNLMPLVVRMYRPWYNAFLIKLNPDKISESIDYTEKVTKTFAPDHPFEYLFLDDFFNELYKIEREVGKAFKYFAFLAIFISCLGLFGLASYMTERRTKEIGIRKVLGAPVSGIIVLLIKEFVKWIVAANIIAWPLAWFLMNKWLNTFAYKTTFSWWIFIVAGIIGIIIATVTVILQVIRTANTNPVDSLRYE